MFILPVLLLIVNAEMDLRHEMSNLANIPGHDCHSHDCDRSTSLKCMRCDNYICHEHKEVRIVNNQWGGYICRHCKNKDMDIFDEMGGLWIRRRKIVG